MTAPSGRIVIDESKLYQLIAQGLGGDPISASSVSLGPTGRKYQINMAFSDEPPRYHTQDEQADFALGDILNYDDKIELDDDTLQYLVEQAVLAYVTAHADAWRAAVLHHAEAFKQEMLASPAGD